MGPDLQQSCKQPYAAMVCHLMVATVVIHLLTLEGWKDELA